MTFSYQNRISSFKETLYKIESELRSKIECANLAIALSTQTLNDLKSQVELEGFNTKSEEIHFFKTVKVIPMQYLIFYMEVRSSEIGIPKTGKSNQILFLQKLMDKTNAFFGKHTEFLVYLNQGYTHFDEHYFTRKYLHDNPCIKSYPYYKNPTFNTSHDGILARLRGMALFGNYLNQKTQVLEQGSTPNSEKENQNILKWTGSYVAFVEMVYGCDAMAYFNNGNIEINTIIEVLGNFLSVPKGNSSRTYNELKNRKHSRIKFFEEASQKLLDKMTKEDGLNNF